MKAADEKSMLEDRELKLTTARKRFLAEEKMQFESEKNKGIVGRKEENDKH